MIKKEFIVTMDTKIKQHRAIWHSRRGMLELDVLLIPFARYQFHLISATLQDLYLKFIQHEDTQLYDWLINQEALQDIQFQEIIKLILQYAPLSVQHMD